MADQLGAKFVGCDGHLHVAVTPTLDGLARDGVQMSRCYATHPICAPNRATLLTGRSCVTHGITSNNLVLNPNVPTYAHLLRHAGYHTGGFGKFHVTPMCLPHPPDLNYLGFDEVAITEDTKWGAYMSWIQREHPDHLETALAMAWGNPPQAPSPDLGDRFRQPRLSAIRERIMKPCWPTADWPEYYTSPLPAPLHQTTWITDQALDFMRRHVEERKDQPFFCKISYVDPHDPYDPPQPYADLFSPADMPPATPGAWMNPGNVLFEARRCTAAARIPEIRAKYAGSVRFIDDQLARVVQFLRDHNLWENSILVFTTDHGDCMGDQELFTKTIIPYDAAIRVPLIVAGGPVARAEVDRLICTLDFFPTFCDWAGIPPSDRPPIEGKSFAAETRGEVSPEQWSAVSVTYQCMDTVISADGWRLTNFNQAQAPNQLINLTEDPDEQLNRYRDPDCASVCRRLFEEATALRISEACLSQYRNMPIVDNQKVTAPADLQGAPTHPLPLYHG